MEKYCPGCQITKSVNDFCLNRSHWSGRQNYCKLCKRVRDNQRSAMLRQADVLQEESQSNSSSDTKQKEEYLYILGNSRLSELKIGRSADPIARALQLQSGHPFTICVLAMFPRAGHIEMRVHDALESKRVRNVAGREWFACSLREALDAIALTLET